ncbi:hypothetical protein WJX72_009420 [[Myrmecia] bisecta]|uniref:Tetratricopeptide repeat protein 1 n=1 Tax=[Myrmecia] bisecta TaxID=41462 RepID=A0AAW1P5P4_9CHLO
MSAEEEEKRLAAAEESKQEGNQLYGAGEYEDAVDKYTDALEAAPERAKQRAVYFANRAACHLKLRQFAQAARDCSAAIDLDPTYLKAWLRRCTAYGELDDLDRALADASKIVELDPGNAGAVATVRRLTPIVEERREKMKEEMIGKLKELGNTVLGKFGMSLDNFKAEKDPATGSYSINFKQ